MKKVWHYIKSFILFVPKIIKKWGFFGLLAVVTLYIPLWLGYVLQDQEMIAFGWRWVAIWAMPFPPAWLAVILLASFYKWLYIRILVLIRWTREAIVKLQLQNQLAAYLTSEEIYMILEMAKKVHQKSETKRSRFRERLRKERLKMIDDQWTKEVEENQPQRSDENDGST